MCVGRFDLRHRVHVKHEVQDKTFVHVIAFGITKCKTKQSAARHYSARLRFDLRHRVHSNNEVHACTKVHGSGNNEVQACTKVHGSGCAL